MVRKLDLRNPHRPIHVGVILLGGTTEIMDVAPVDYMYQISSDYIKQWPDAFLPENSKEQAVDIKFHWVNETGAAGQASLSSGVTVIPTDSFESCPLLDIVVFGAHNIGYQPSEKELVYVRKLWEECTAFITICGGVEVPIHAGLLKGKTVTCPRFFVDYYRGLEPEANWVEKRWIRDGKLWTSGALLNGQDLMHAFTHEFWGEREDALLRTFSKFGSWVHRDVDYKDEIRD